MQPIRNTARFDRLYDSLPRITPRPVRGYDMPLTCHDPFRYPLGLGYMGFSSVERAREWQLQVWLARGGFLPSAKVCSICGTEKRVSYHAENYYDIWTMNEICQSCHTILHRRFWKFRRTWRDLIETHRKTGDEWFVLTPRAGEPEQDFAGYLRFRFGDNYRFVERTSLEGVIPDRVVGKVPANLLRANYIPPDGMSLGYGLDPVPARTLAPGEVPEVQPVARSEQLVDIRAARKAMLEGYVPIRGRIARRFGVQPVAPATAQAALPLSSVEQPADKVRVRHRSRL